MTRLEDRQILVRDIEQACADGARLAPACALAGIERRRQDASTGQGRSVGHGTHCRRLADDILVGGQPSDATLSRFARLRVRRAHAAEKRGEAAAEQWLLIEWPQDEAEPDRYWLSARLADISFEQLVDQAKQRWRLERDYQDLKQEVGLGHYEGRSWRGFHHHASLCIRRFRLPGLRGGDDFPPQDLPAPGAARDLPFPRVTELEALPLQSQRHMPNSINILRIRLARMLLSGRPAKYTPNLREAERIACQIG